MGGWVDVCVCVSVCVCVCVFAVSARSRLPKRAVRLATKASKRAWRSEADRRMCLATGKGKEETARETERVRETD